MLQPLLVASDGSVTRASGSLSEPTRIAAAPGQPLVAATADGTLWLDTAWAGRPSARERTPPTPAEARSAQPARTSTAPVGGRRRLSGCVDALRMRAARLVTAMSEVVRGPPRPRRAPRVRRLRRPAGALVRPLRRLAPRSRPAHAPSPLAPGLPPTWTVTTYDGAVREALLAHKEHGRLGLAGPLGAALSRSVAAAVAASVAVEAWPPVVLVPVPSARAATRARGHDPLLRTAAARRTCSAPRVVRRRWSLCCCGPSGLRPGGPRGLRTLAQPVRRTPGTCSCRGPRPPRARPSSSSTTW